MIRHGHGAEVARVAGGSRASVSHVLDDRQDVKITEVVRQRVHAVAKELGYPPSPAARALRAGRGDVVDARVRHLRGLRQCPRQWDAGPALRTGPR